IAYMRAWVNGPGIANSIYASGGDADGFISVAGNPDPVGFAAIPKGRFRVVKVQFYDINRQPLQAAYAMSVYSSPASGSINLEINRRNIPLAELVQYLLQNNPAFLEE